MKEFIFKTGQGSRNCNEKDIIKIISNSNYCKIYFDDSTTLVTAKVLKWFETELTPGLFIRINHSVLININYINAVNLKEKTLTSNFDNETFIISKRRLSAIKASIFMQAGNVILTMPGQMKTETS
jgi:two-component system LytT family response regulator